MNQKSSRTDLSALSDTIDRSPDCVTSLKTQCCGPLNYAQQRLWYLYQTSNEQHQFNLVLSVILRGSVDRQQLNRAINGLIARHPALHSRIETFGNGRQVIGPAEPTLLREEDLSEIPPAEQDKRIHDYRQKELHNPFDLTESTAPRWRLFKRAADNYQLVMTVHHIVFDGLSFIQTVKTLARLYSTNDLSSRANVPSGPCMIDHALQEQSEEMAQTWRSSLDFWHKRLSNLPTHITLPIPRAPKEGTGSFRLTLDASSLKQIQKWARARRVSFFVAFKAAFDLILFHHCGQPCFLVGTDISSRPLPTFAETMGFFINQLPLPCEIDPAAPMTHWLKQMNEDVHSALRYRHLPFNFLVSSQAKDRNQAYSPLFQVKMNYQKRRIQGVRFGEAVVTDNHVHQHMGPFYLVLDLVHEEDGLKGLFEFQKRLFSPQKIQLMAMQWLRLLENFESLMQGTVAEADARLAEWDREAQAVQQQNLSHNSRAKLKRRRAN